jgi:hypothetical protein
LLSAEWKKGNKKVSTENNIDEVEWENIRKWKDESREFNWLPD